MPACALVFLALIGDPEPVDFQRDIRPLLSDRCFICHGPDSAAREGGFRLDRFESATEDLGGYAAIVPGDAAASEVVLRIRDARHPMPPIDSKLSLFVEEVDLLERWIEEGARYDRHWAFVPPARPALPVVERAEWPRDEIDLFVLAEIEGAGLKPAPPTDRARWIRRVSFDLTGLPPTLEDVDAFLADESDSAHERVVDRLLASPHYGERMASDWLDVARYADTYGYQNDVARRVWPWRDWVISAFNENLSYDDFVTWQLAGDLLPEATHEQRLATAFNRLHRQTNEGGSVEEEYRVEYVSDRVHTFGTAFLGMTFECARCHDHRYDPITQKDYYRVSAFFDNIDESGLYSHFTHAVPTPTLLLPTEEQAARRRELEELIAAKEGALRTAENNAEAFERWRTDSTRSVVMVGPVAHFDFEEVADAALANRVAEGPAGRVHENPEVVPSHVGNGLLLSGGNNATFPDVGAFTRDDAFSLSLWIRTPDVKERAVVVHCSQAWTDSGSRGYQVLIEEGRLSASLIHFWPGNAISVKTHAAIPVSRWVHVAMTYDGSSRAHGLGVFVDGERAATEVIRDDLRKSITGGGCLLTIGQRFRDRGFTGGQVDEFKVFDRELSSPEIAALLRDEPLADVLAELPRFEREYFARAVHAPAHALREELHVLREEHGALVDSMREIMTMAELAEPRTTYVLERGSYLNRGDTVEPGTPASVFAFASDLPPDRSGLARWLTAQENPLFARVAVNRLWQLAFGAGLVATTENFGSQGALPTHAALLDHLATDLRESGWDIKAMLKRLVLSATYRQSSRAGRELRDVDPENRLIARAPARRLGAEMIRDQALFVSGLLVDKVGGPPVKPYQPAGLWKDKSGAQYKADEGPGLVRRSLYTFWKRTSPPPSMMIFDAAKRDVCVVRRQETNTPLQALALWNDPQQVEAACKLAERVMQDETASDDERLARVYRLATGLRPAEEERRVLRTLYDEARADFSARPEAAAELLGACQAALDDTLDELELSALAIVANAVFASDAAVVLR